MVHNFNALTVLIKSLLIIDSVYCTSHEDTNFYGAVKQSKNYVAEGTQTDCNTDDEQLTCRDSFERVETDLAERLVLL